MFCPLSSTAQGAACGTPSLSLPTLLQSEGPVLTCVGVPYTPPWWQWASLPWSLDFSGNSWVLRPHSRIRCCGVLAWQPPHFTGRRAGGACSSQEEHGLIWPKVSTEGSSYSGQRVASALGDSSSQGFQEHTLETIVSHYIIFVIWKKPRFCFQINSTIIEVKGWPGPIPLWLLKVFPKFIFRNCLKDPQNIIFYVKVLFIFLERGEGREKKEGEKHQCVVSSYAPPNGDLACNPGMCPGWELNQQPFGS